MNSSILESFYQFFAETNSSDSEQIKSLFKQLDDTIPYLSLEENNRIFSIVCSLCTEYEQRAYIAGFRNGTQLMKELQGTLSS